jgi:hypothetical protein
VKCIKCGGVKIYIQTENLDDSETWLARVACADCGATQATQKAHNILTEV